MNNDLFVHFNIDVDVDNIDSDTCPRPRTSIPPSPISPPSRPQYNYNYRAIKEHRRELHSDITAVRVSIHTVSIFIRDNINWNKFAQLCKQIDTQFNDAQWRFFKALIFETAIQAFSCGLLIYVADKGCDFIIPMLNNAKIEMKYIEHALFAPKSNTPRKTTRDVTLMNSKGSNTHITLPDSYADFLLIVGARGAAIIDKIHLIHHIHIKGDSITAVIPTDQMHFIFTPDTIQTSTKSLTPLYMKEKIMKFVLHTIEHC